MKIIVGLGNPGQKYRDTRHNMGYRVIEELARRYSIDREECKFDSIIGHLRINGERILIVKPLTYMNLSGMPPGDLDPYHSTILVSRHQPSQLPAK
jgi:PTH1 family peptidyl-tRNA hydrolase